MAEGSKESHFEEHITKYLKTVAEPEFTEYEIKDSSCYDKDLCLIPEDFIGFLKDSQPKKYEAMLQHPGSDSDQKIVTAAARSLSNLKDRTLDFFRTKLKISGQHVETVYFKPSHNRTPEHEEGYKKNRLTIIRQLKYSKLNSNSIDIVIFINGIPVVTIELKNAL